jgi:ribose transport system ATP-binding protein
MSVVVTGLTKSFNEQPALDGVSITIERGEIHGLLGQNGSGKSTLIKVLAGFHAPDAGELAVDGREIELPMRPGVLRELGFAFVHQDLGLIATISVLENLRMTSLAEARGPIRWRRMHREAREVLQRYGIDIDTRALVEELTPVQRSMLAIVRAVESVSGSDRAQVGALLVLDEPTVYLPQREVDTLFALVRQVAALGVGVLFVSHDLDEVLEICDRVTVLRDGRLADTVPVEGITKAALVELIVGHEVAEHHSLDRSAREIEGHGDPLRIEHASGRVLDDVSFELRPGEIVGVTGLAGSGFDELPYLLFGAVPVASGTMTVPSGAEIGLKHLTPRRAETEKIGLIPGDRQSDACVQDMTLSENVTLPVVGDFFSGFRLRHDHERSYSTELLERFLVHPPEPDMRAGDLSGGNQQKVVLAKWLQTSPRLLLLDEPTQGVDIGARAQIFVMLRDQADNGAAIVCASSDHEQLAALCDRVLIFSRGRLVVELAGHQLTKQEITEQCLIN